MGHKRFGCFRLGRLPGFSKVTRYKSGTISGRYRSNGYVPGQQNPGRLSGRHREQARSHSLIEVQPGETGRLSGRLASKLCSHRGLEVGANIPASTKQMWERACSRWRCVSRHRCQLNRRLREQARSHKFCALITPRGNDQPPSLNQTFGQGTGAQSPRSGFLHMLLT